MPGWETETLQSDTYPARCEEEEEQGPGHCPRFAEHPEKRDGKGFLLPPDSLLLLRRFPLSLWRKPRSSSSLNSLPEGACPALERQSGNHAEMGATKLSKFQGTRADSCDPGGDGAAGTGCSWAAFQVGISNTSRSSISISQFFLFLTPRG